MSDPQSLPADQDIDPGTMLAALRERGADGFDPIRFRFIEAMARRADACRGEARRLVDQKLAKALTEYSQRFEQARSEAGKALHQVTGQFPEAADDLAGLYDAGDFSGLSRRIAGLEGQVRRSPLGDLLEQLAQHVPEKADEAAAGGMVAAPGTARAELKSVRYFRDTWSRLSMDQQLAQALAQVPENAGPLNSHLLVLQALKLMRDVSPDYLNRFISYVDALLWLDQANPMAAPAAKGAARGDSDKKRKSSRSKSA